MSEKESMLPATPGERVKAELKAAGIKQVELAKSLGKDPQYINQIIRGKRNLTVEIAEKVADLTGIRKEYLLGFDDCRTEREYLEGLNNSLSYLLDGIDIYFQDVALIRLNKWLDFESQAPEDVYNPFYGPVYEKYIFTDCDDKSEIVIDYTEMGEYKRELMDYAEFLLRKIIMKHTGNGKLFPENGNRREIL